MPNKSLYFKDKNDCVELKTLTKSLLYKENMSLRYILKSPKYYCITDVNTVTVIPLFNCENILSSNKNDRQNDDHNAIFCEYKLDTILYFNYYEGEIL